MEAIKFIKENNKKYIGYIDNTILDNEKHNYDYYKQLLKIKKYKKNIILTLDNNKLIINDNEYNETKILNTNEIYYRNMYYKIQDEYILITNKQHIKNILENKNNKNKYNKYLYCKFLYENNKCEITINGTIEPLVRIYIFILSNNNIEKLTINNNISLDTYITYYKGIIDIFVENITMLKQLICPFCKIINYSNNILYTKTSYLYDCKNIKKIKYKNIIDDGHNGDIIKMSEITKKYPNLEELTLKGYFIDLIFDCSINLKKLNYDLIGGKLIFKNNNITINCNDIIINIENIININYLSKNNITINFSINNKYIFDKDTIKEIKNIKEKINCNKLIIELYKSKYKFDKEYVIKLNKKEFNELINNIFDYNEILFINE